jgi:hypothetical protein
MGSSAVAKAAYELKICKLALETWSFQNDFPKENVTIRRFRRSDNSLSTVLEKFDEAQDKLYQARRRVPHELPPAVVNLARAPLDKARPGKREGKKKRQH